MKKILLVEDEPTINRMIYNYLLKEGYEVTQAFDGKAAIDAIKKDAFHLVCLDIMLPKMSGWDIAKHLRENSDVPIIMMSALSDEEDILKGFDLKVDDYITKPFNPRVLVAKINALLARFSKEKSVPKHHIKIPHLSVDTKRKVIQLDDQALPLARKEYELLTYFIEHPNEICSREHLFNAVWGKDVGGDPRLVDTYVKKLRKHLADYADFIKTIFGVGYRFEAYD